VSDRDDYLADLDIAAGADTALLDVEADLRLARTTASTALSPATGSRSGYRRNDPRCSSSGWTELKSAGPLTSSPRPGSP
jgi:hypothetical protein